MQTIESYIAFPVVTAAHFTLGGGYDFEEYGRVDASFVYGTGFSDSYVYTDLTGTKLINATNEQTSFTVDYTYNF